MPKVTDEHRAARREQILDAAMRCAVRDGFHKTTMAQVIAESELSAGAVYGYFKGKTALIEALAERSFSAFAAALEEVAAAPGPVTIDGAFAAVVERVDAVIAETKGGLGKMGVHTWSEAARDEAVAAIVRRNLRALHRGWVEVLARAEGDGTIRPGIDHDRLARALMGLMPGYIVQGALLGEVEGPAYSSAVADLLTCTAMEPAPDQG